jgi:RimJ/RimL family protein N-acetyltransferase
MGLNHVSLTVADRERSAAFYREHFGLEQRVFETATTIVLGAPDGATLALEQGDVPAGLPHGNHFGFQLEGPDAVRAARARLRAAGVTEAEFRDKGDFARVQVLDPDGYRVELVGRAPEGRPPGIPEPVLALSLPAGGIADGVVRLRLPTEDDVDGLLPAFREPDILEAGNLPPFGRKELLATLPHLPALAAGGRLLPMVATDVASGEVTGGATLHHLDAERAIVEIGYWVLPHARRRGLATRITRLLAEHAFALGVVRVAAYVNVGNAASERVLERAGYEREGVVRSMPVPSGVRRDKTLFARIRA